MEHGRVQAAAAGGTRGGDAVSAGCEVCGRYGVQNCPVHRSWRVPVLDPTIPVPAKPSLSDQTRDHLARLACERHERILALERELAERPSHETDTALLAEIDRLTASERAAQERAEAAEKRVADLEAAHTETIATLRAVAHSKAKARERAVRAETAARELYVRMAAWSQMLPTAFADVLDKHRAFGGGS